MSIKTLIGIAGTKGVGKDTTAEILERQLGGSVKRIAFADPLKRGVAAMLGWSSVEIMESQCGKETPIPGFGNLTLRHIYQTLGTEWAQGYLYPEFWVTLAIRAYLECERSGVEHVIFTDVRFEHEASWIRGAGGTILHLTRPTDPKVTRPFWARWRKHRSEAGVRMLEEDHWIGNTSDLAALRGEVMLFLQTLKWGV